MNQRKYFAILLFLVSLAWLGACTSPGTLVNPPLPCSVDSNCPTGMLCQAGFCSKSSTERVALENPDASSESLRRETPPDTPTEAVTPESPKEVAKETAPDSTTDFVPTELPADAKLPDNPCVDEDKDGYCADSNDPSQKDCDDKNDKIYPGATELCDGVDNNCNGQIDENFDEKDAACKGDGKGVCGQGLKACEAGKIVCKLNTASQELCDGLDNDCDGQVDNDPQGEDGKCSTGLSGICANGKLLCKDGKFACIPKEQPKKEECNQQDDNCDGTIDEGCSCKKDEVRDCYTGQSGTEGQGLCKKGKQGCVSGKWGACIGEVVPSQEVCDGKDNNCDGMTDEDFPGRGDACQTTKSGICKAGLQQCVGGKSECVPNHAPKPEVCNQQDDDCNGQIDDGGVCGECQPAQTRSCYNGPAGTAGVGICQKGTQTCTVPRKWGPCTGSVEPTAESCDGKDNDCDGQIDESDPLLGTPCDTTAQGICKPGKQACTNGALKCVQTQQPQKEICNQKDDDCDGQTDEDQVCGECKDGESRPCYTGAGGTLGNGDCKQGAQLCVNRKWSASCTGQVLPATEICDGKDNDCDGSIDEGLLTTYYRDEDKDTYGDPAQAKQACTQPAGYITRAGDCDDKDDNARPNQSGYFTSARKGKQGFDYNCNNQEEKQTPQGQCYPRSVECRRTAGYNGTPAACGKSGSYIENCGWRWQNGGWKCVPVRTSNRTQACR